MNSWTTELTPLSFLGRSADVWADKTAVAYGSVELTYRELADRVQQLAAALRAAGVERGDRVAYLMPNIPEMIVAHFAVPLAGAVLVAINTRLAADEVRYICDHSGAVLLVVDSGLASTIATVAGDFATVNTVVVARDTEADVVEAYVPGAISYSDLLSGSVATNPLDWSVPDENDIIAINYTSGTTGRPKGVMYTHRGSYLNAMGELIHSSHTPDSVYLWTLPMFHCNGWCTAWALVAIGGTQVCLREVRGEKVWELIEEYDISHLNGAPTVITTILNSSSARTLDRPILITTAGAPPSPTTILESERMGFTIVHVYGLTETYGPYAVCQWRREWDGLDQEHRSRLRSRQGVGMIQADRLRVVEHGGADDRLIDVPADGTSMGEIVMRGNNVMKGYYRDDNATASAFAGGWFHSGDLGVMHPDGHVELRDRAKDVVVSGGENISTIEVEQALLSHHAVQDVAVIAVPDQRWGERPKAFVVLKPATSATEGELLDYVRSVLARYKAPRAVEFVTSLPKTATGKVQKFALREKEWAGEQSRIKG